MNGKLLWRIAVTFGSLSLVSVGGTNVVVPGMHRQVVEVLGWMNDSTFANLFALSQAAPGPALMIIALIGWHVCGFTGLCAALLSWVVPTSMIAVTAGRLFQFRANVRWIGRVKEGLVPIAIGLTLAAGLVVAQAADHGVPGIVITLGAAMFVIVSDRNPVWALAAGAFVSMFSVWRGFTV